MRSLFVLAVLAALAPACSSSSDDAAPPAGGVGGSGGGDGDAGPEAETPAGNPHNASLAPDQRCPGDPGCPAGDDATLWAAAASEDITPQIVNHAVHASGSKPWNWDAQGGDYCADPDGKPLAIDQCVWMATGPRPALDVADPTSVRCVVMKQGETKVGLCSVDAIGWFYNEVERTRAILPAELGLDLLVVSATHLHETQDTLGYFGPDQGTTGLSKAYNQRIREKTRDALVAANAALKPVHVQMGAIKVNGQIPGTDPAGIRTNAFVSDTRDPVVLDDELRTIRFLGADDGKTVATLVNWTSHAEWAGADNPHITADMPGALRDALEKGLDETDADGKPIHYDGLGGVALFFPGALGGQVGPGDVHVFGFDGKERTIDGATKEGGLEKARTNGKMIAVYAFESLKSGATTLETAPLGFRARELYVDVHNRGYHVALGLQLFDREAYFFDPTRPLGEGNVPALKTQEVVLDVGPAEMISIPGELHAELLLATREGKTSLEAPYPFTPAPYQVLNDKASNPDCDTFGHSRCDDGPPAIEKMDRTKVLDLFRDAKAQYRWLIGLGQDEVGYVVPEYDYIVDPANPYIDEASPGDHYEETNSVGANVESDVCAPMRQLLRTPPVVAR